MTGDVKELTLDDLSDVTSCLDWHDYLFALRLGLVSPATVVRLAEHRSLDEKRGPAEELALLLSHQHDQVDGILQRNSPVLATSDPAEVPPETRRIWIFLLLRRIYREAAESDHARIPSLIEDVYELFDHPPELWYLIWYHPRGSAPTSAKKTDWYLELKNFLQREEGAIRSRRVSGIIGDL